MLSDLRSGLRPALLFTLLIAVFLGVLYPLALTGAGQMLFPSQANGSLIRENGKVIGSALIGQNFTSPRYFHGRPSAAGKGYDAMASSGSNYGPTSQALVDRIKADHAALPKTPSAIPADMLTTSGSGLDPHISPANAQMQVNRVAQARSMAPAVLSRLVKAQTETPLLGFIGEPRVNVLALNRALDRINAQRQP